MNYSNNPWDIILPTNDSATPKIRNTNISGLVVKHAQYAWLFKGLPESPIKNVRPSNISFELPLINVPQGIKPFEQYDDIFGTCDNSNVLPHVHLVLV
jgi:hypothetical protein